MTTLKIVLAAVILACPVGAAAEPARTSFLLVQEFGLAPPVRLWIPASDRPRPSPAPDASGATREISVSLPKGRPLAGFSLTLPVHDATIKDVQHSIAHGNYKPLGQRYGLPAYQLTDDDGRSWLDVYLIGWRGGAFVDINCLDTDFSRLAYCHFGVIDRHGVGFGTELTPAQVAHWAEYVDEFNGMMGRYTASPDQVSGAGSARSGTGPPRRR